MGIEGKRMVLWLIAYLSGGLSKVAGADFGKVADFAVYMLMALTFFWLFKRWFREKLPEDRTGSNNLHEAGDA